MIGFLTTIAMILCPFWQQSNRSPMLHIGTSNLPMERLQSD